MKQTYYSWLFDGGFLTEMALPGHFANCERRYIFVNGVQIPDDESHQGMGGRVSIAKLTLKPGDFVTVVDFKRGVPFPSYITLEVKQVNENSAKLAFYARG